MRIRLTIATGALVLACTGVTEAQQTAASGATLFGLRGTVDFGFRGTDYEGDGARYERYRDLRSGVFSRVVLGDETERRRVALRLENIGYRDGFYGAEYDAGRTRVAGSFDSIPLNYSYLTMTPWTETSTGVFELDDTIQGLVQNRTPGVVGIPTTVAQLATPSLYRVAARQVDLRSRRDTISASVGHDFTPGLGLSVSVQSYKRSGNQPFGMSFAFNNANELPIPVDNRTNNVNAGLEYATEQGSIRVGWEASYFNNQISQVIWDNPVRLTDFSPYDPSGYSNGNGPARGRMAMPPSNSMNMVNTTGLYRLAPRTTISGSVAFFAMNQNEALIPWTINPAIANPGVYGSFPGLANLPRATAEAKVHGLNGVFNFTSRPNNFFGLNMRYRVNDHRNLTPAFDGREYVRFDAVPEEIEHGISQNFSIRQNTFDLTGTFKVAKFTAVNLGYIYDDYERTGRSYSDMRDYTLRASIDTLGNRWVTVRAAFDHTTRIGSGFSEASIEDGGLQPGLRFFDESDRERDRGSLLFVLTPGSAMDVTLQFAKGRDIYKGEGHEFGLLDNDNTTVNIGTSWAPVTQVTLGANYGRDQYNSHQSARNANPPCGLNVPPCRPGTYDSWFDPNRTWFLDNDENVNNFLAFVDLERLVPKTDVRLAYDYSDSDQAFIHSGPRITALASNAILTAGDTRPCAAGLTSCFDALPNVTNKWQRFTADIRYGITSRVGLAVSYWYEKLDITDFATLDLAPDVPRIDYLGLLSTGYGNRPYRGSTGFLRLLYSF